MTGTRFVILAYAIGLGLLWGQAVLMWWETRSTARREKNVGGQS